MLGAFRWRLQPTDRLDVCIKVLAAEAVPLGTVKSKVRLAIKQLRQQRTGMGKDELQR